MRTADRFRRHVRPVRAMLLGGLAASVVAALMTWATPWPLKFVVDSVIGHRPLPSWLHGLPAGRGPRLVVLVGAMVAVAAALAAADYAATRLVATAGQQIVFGLRGELFRHLEAQGAGFHQRRRTGDLLARLGGDVQAIQSAVVNAVPTLVRNVLTLAGMVVIMVVVDWRYALLATALVPVLAVTARWYLGRIKAIQRRARRADGQASGIAQEVLSSIAVVQAFGAEETEAARYRAATAEGLEASRRAIVAQAELTPLMTLGMTTSSAVVVLFGARAVLSGSLTVGELLVFVAYLRGMYSPVRQLSKLAGVVSRAQAAAERVVEILDTDEQVPTVASPRRLARATDAVALEGVHLAYPGGRSVLAGVDLEVPAGSRLALVGLTGSGKSTILRLLPRFVDPDRGTVRLDGLDLTTLHLGDLRRQVALVPQEPYLFAATVWENVVYGGVPDRAAARAAATAAGVHDVIESFPAGYDTVVGERGSTLSGGQRQCVAVARAMARDAPVLVLDEPTVGLDAALESVLLAAFDAVAEGRTTVVVSHQLAGLRNADRIAVLSNGVIAESGTHDQLLAARRTYWRLDRLQRGEPDSVPAAGARAPAGQRASDPRRQTTGAS